MSVETVSIRFQYLALFRHAAIGNGQIRVCLARHRNGHRRRPRRMAGPHRRRRGCKLGISLSRIGSNLDQDTSPKTQVGGNHRAMTVNNRAVDWQAFNHCKRGLQSGRAVSHVLRSVRNDNDVFVDHPSTDCHTPSNCGVASARVKLQPLSRPRRFDTLWSVPPGFLRKRLDVWRRDDGRKYPTPHRTSVTCRMFPMCLRGRNR